MAASAKVHTVDNHTWNGDWTVVLPRRSKQQKNNCKTKTTKDVQHRVIPTTLESDPDGQSRLMQKMQICIKEVENSSFFEKFFKQVQTPDVLDSFHRVLDNNPKMDMVIYGIGNIELYENPRQQLSVAILMKRMLSWIGDIEVFDPVLSATECKVLEALGCSVLSVNENGRRHATKPMLFYMPHCEAQLYNHLLEANWAVDELKRIALLGNSFTSYQRFASEFKKSVLYKSASCVLYSRRFTTEYSIQTVSDDYFEAFHDLSWQFFTPDTGQLQDISLFGNK